MKLNKVILILLCTGLLWGCGKKEVVIPEPDSRPAKLFTVSVGQHSTTRTFPALVEAGDKAILAFRVPGQLYKVNIKSGQHVSKGEVLAELNPDEFTLLYKQAKARYQLIFVQYERMEKLRKDQVISEQDFDTAKAALSESKSMLDQAKANLDYTQLIAPYDGDISLMLIDNHEFVAAKQNAMHIQTNDILSIVFQLPDNLFHRFAFSDDITAEVIFDAFPGKRFEVEFQEIDTEADVKTASYKVTMVMERPETLGVLPGMSAQIHALVPRGKNSKIPSTAIINDEQGTWVWKVNSDNRVERIKVDIDKHHQITGGLNDGDKIVMTGVSGLVDNMQIHEWIKERGL
ncbi:efflux RND transporter periplasmic adaptor subunit [Aliivibrio kagoshimensis]|uniref:efflux RND transporter periplasmic adaptor subunit n=1 Tax=Aliivibrio kagoshimensis TaxID=2910230 RepID=UPI003D0979F3